MKLKLFIPLIVIFSVLADQLSKWAVLEHVIKPRLKGSGEPVGFAEWIIHANERLAFVRIELTSFLNTVMVWNTGISFGMFKADSLSGAYAMAALALVISTVLLIWSIRTKNIIYIVLASFICGGAIGNVIDRVRFGAVADFIDVHAFGYHWPAFNVADSFISVSVFLMVIYGVFLDRNAKGNEKDNSITQSGGK